LTRDLNAAVAAKARQPVRAAAFISAPGRVTPAAPITGARSRTQPHGRHPRAGRQSEAGAPTEPLQSQIQQTARRQALRPER